MTRHVPTWVADKEVGSGYLDVQGLENPAIHRTEERKFRNVTILMDYGSTEDLLGIEVIWTRSEEYDDQL